MTHLALDHVFPRERLLHRIIVVAEEHNADRFSSFIAAGRCSQFKVLRLIRAGDGPNCAAAIAQITPDWLRNERIWGIVVATADRCLLPPAALLQWRLQGIRLLGEAEFWEREGKRIEVDCTDFSWVFDRDGFRRGSLTEVIKRAIDIITAAALIVFTLPLMLIVALLIRAESEGPALYRQERVGLHGRPFVLLKFRSMRADAEAGSGPRWAAHRDPRITRVGRLIRYIRVDELPQLLNVLRGEMSIVGPRPERPYFVDQLAQAIPFYAQRHCVKPGITGWAQINAPYGASVEDAREKLRYDLYYIKNRSSLLDFRILFATVRVVLFQEGAR